MLRRSKQRRTTEAEAKRLRDEIAELKSELARWRSLAAELRDFLDVEQREPWMPDD